jgi:hypothetical protein
LKNVSIFVTFLVNLLIVEIRVEPWIFILFIFFFLDRWREFGFCFQIIHELYV